MQANKFPACKRMSKGKINEEFRRRWKKVVYYLFFNKQYFRLENPVGFRDFFQILNFSNKLIINYCVITCKAKSHNY